MATSKPPPPNTTQLARHPLALDPCVASATPIGTRGPTIDGTNGSVVDDRPESGDNASAADTERQATTARAASPARSFGRGTAGITA
jgi:hypothetical protein